MNHVGTLVRGLIGLVFAIGLISCVVKPQPAGPAEEHDYNAVEGSMQGKAPLVISNYTPHHIQYVDLELADVPPGGRTESGTIYLGENYHSKRPVIAPSSTQDFKVKPGVWLVTLRSHKFVEVLLKKKLHLTEAGTRVLVYEGDKPPPEAPPAPAGYTAVETTATYYAQSKAHARVAAIEHDQQAARTAAGHKECAAKVPAADKPAPGKVRVDGRWTCVIGGTWTGTDHMNIVQLADGKITATITGGPDASRTWSGAVVGSELQFRYADDSYSGGRLKLDPGGRAMTGDAVAMNKGGDCKPFTLTCTKN
ncbi:MAG: hypothetical protein KIT84_31455 [Labilithrix sp.]|nr:hypothetical protein [Labilithrix sp.]MCW5815587.1 hypothetical protein [Labilithrix sp.]